MRVNLNNKHEEMSPFNNQGLKIAGNAQILVNFPNLLCKIVSNVSRLCV